MKAVKCPVCEGSGQIMTVIPDGTSLRQDGSTTTCHGCDGKGWVAVGTNDYLEVDEDGFVYKMSIDTTAR